MESDVSILPHKRKRNEKKKGWRCGRICVCVHGIHGVKIHWASDTLTCCGLMCVYTLYWAREKKQARHIQFERSLRNDDSLIMSFFSQVREFFPCRWTNVSLLFVIYWRGTTTKEIKYKTKYNKKWGLQYSPYKLFNLGNSKWAGYMFLLFVLHRPCIRSPTLIYKKDFALLDIVSVY